MKLPSAPDLSVPNEVEPGKDISIGWNYYGDDSINETVVWNVAVEIQVYISSWATVYTGKLSTPSYRMPYNCDSIKVRARVTYSGYEASAWSSAVTVKAANVAPTVPSSISIPEAVYGGASITITWGPSTDANNNLSGYEAWRAVNGGSSWTQIYQGLACSATDTVPAGMETVQYRVRAYDTKNAFSGWKTSAWVTVLPNTAPTVPAAVTIPETIHGGKSVTVSWTASTDEQGNLEGYAVERSTDGGSSWTQIYQGGELSTTNTVAFGTESVMYRVRAYDSEGLYSGYRNSAQVIVINNTAPTAPGAITVPETVFGGSCVEISWTASMDGENNLAGYTLERQTDGGNWAEIFRGNALGFTDTLTKGWLSVAYRVRAYDSENAYSGYTASGTRAVDNNTPPTITCEQANGTDLGVKDEGFSIIYSVGDEDGDPVTVTESIDGAVLRTFAAVDGAENTLQLDGLSFLKVLSGTHTLAITASDHKVSAVHNLTFIKSVTSAVVSLARPMTADAPISVCVLSVTGSIPADAQYSVKVTNNAKDGQPVWEDCTTAVKTGANHIFANQTAVNGFAFNFKVEVERGESGLGGYISSIQGGFQ